MEVHFLLEFFIGFLSFFKMAFFMVGYISNNSLFPEPLSAEDEKMYFKKTVWRWFSNTQIDQ